MKHQSGWAGILVGPPGCGKGTNAEQFRKESDAAYFNTGDMLRKRKQEDAGFAERVQASINNGKLVSDELVMETVRAWLDEVPEGQPVLFDGIPRTQAQAHLFIPLLKLQNYDPIVTVEFILSRHECRNRILGRRKDDEMNNRPVRNDDDEKVLKGRLDIYFQNLPAIESYLRKQTKFITVNAGGTKGEVYKAVFEAMSLGVLSTF